MNKEYVVTDMVDEDHGCEGLDEGEEPSLIVSLKDVAGNIEQRRVRLIVVEDLKLKVGTKVVLNDNGPLPIVEVGAAVIWENKENKRILATQRGIGNMKGGWEFPGGIVEQGERPERTLVREVHEELGLVVMVGQYIGCVEHDFKNFHLSMKCYFAYIESGNMVLKEHKDAKWLSKDELDSVEWLSADRELLDIIRKKMS